MVLFSADTINRVLLILGNGFPCIIHVYSQCISKLEPGKIDTAVQREMPKINRFLQTSHFDKVLEKHGAGITLAYFRGLLSDF